MTDTLYQDQLSPDFYRQNLVPGVSGANLATVTSAVLNVRLPDGTTTTWPVVMSNQTATTLTLTRLLVTGDISTMKGTYVIYATCTTPSGPVRSVPYALNVKGRFET